jgi:hypothetical protein
MQVDFLVSEFESLALNWGRAAYKIFELHAQHAGVKIDASGLVAGGQDQVIQVVNHVAISELNAAAKTRSGHNALVAQGLDLRGAQAHAREHCVAVLTDARRIAAVSPGRA